MFQTDEDFEQEEEDRRNESSGESTIENPFRYPFERQSYPFETDRCPIRQTELCLSSLRVDPPSDDEDDDDTCPCIPTGFSLKIESDLPLSQIPITDDYRISHEIIGEGESGKVMAVYRIRDGHKFALKVLRDCAKARREIELHWLTHTHENIVSIIDMYENSFEGTACLLLVVEFLEGGDLLTRFESQGSRAYSEHEVGNVMRQIGAAVQHLHDFDIAHRDIKLENILCSSKGPDCVYKLGDFGFAKRPERNTLMESPCCTPFYAPPEVICRERYNKSCDMWSLGVAMYILLSGYPPFYSMKGLQMSPGMKSRISQGYYAFPHEEWDIISDDTKEIVKSLLKTTPAERLTIHDLMCKPLISGEPSPTACESSPERDIVPSDLIVPRSVRFLREGINAPRLHSIQEEVGRWEKNNEERCSPLLARRRSAAIGINQIPA
uniref:non-specific serine/threonine protein kinase n=1 Tax=Pristionchus pacificus TaxID=54126 RepID=A0A8R1YNI3_PRIPA